MFVAHSGATPPSRRIAGSSEICWLQQRRPRSPRSRLVVGWLMRSEFGGCGFWLDGAPGQGQT
jgi:hypothetical protein